MQLCQNRGSIFTSINVRPAGNSSAEEAARGCDSFRPRFSSRAGSDLDAASDSSSRCRDVLRVFRRGIRLKCNKQDYGFHCARVCVRATRARFVSPRRSEIPRSVTLAITMEKLYRAYLRVSARASLSEKNSARRFVPSHASVRDRGYRRRAAPQACYTRVNARRN